MAHESVRGGMGGSSRPHSICWGCRNTAAGLCSYFTDYTPVEGWEAEGKQCVLTNRFGVPRVITSVRVRLCPDFNPEEIKDLYLRRTKEVTAFEQLYLRQADQGTA